MKKPAHILAIGLGMLIGAGISALLACFLLLFVQAETPISRKMIIMIFSIIGGTIGMVWGYRRPEKVVGASAETAFEAVVWLFFGGIFAIVFNAF